MFSTLSEYIFGAPSAPEGPPSEEGGQGQTNPILPADSERVEDDWVVVKNEEESFLLSTEVVTRSRVNLQEDLSRENFLIEHPLSLSSEEIEMRGIKIGRRSKRKAKRSSGAGTTVGRNPSRNTYQALIPNLRNPTLIRSSTNSRALTLIPINNNKPQGFPQQRSSLDKRRRGNYHYKRHSGANNDRNCGKRGSVLLR